MIPLLLIGGGGHCRSCIDVIEAQGRYAVAGIVQPQHEGNESVLGYPILGADDDLPALLAQHPNALITVGQIKTPDVRIRLFAQLKQLAMFITPTTRPRDCVVRPSWPDRIRAGSPDYARFVGRWPGL
ncbi:MULTISPECIES: hypothetical protein [unclassified Thiocapsa]|uniref:PglD-related sugar-binding protein n=1 Tax=unclassified Thiocapsa TaxID=2641286 RepID=UPI0035AEAE05